MKNDKSSAPNSENLKATLGRESAAEKGEYRPAVCAALLMATAFAAVLLFSADRCRDLLCAALPFTAPANYEGLPAPAQFDRELARLKKKVSSQEERLKNLMPKGPYLIINTSENKIALMKDGKPIHEGLCSTGSYTVLKSTEGEEKWVFQTPRGMLRVQNKIVNPVWRMPDWAFIEEGLPVPPPYAAERYEYNVLGDYALDLGNGYLIHGTLYQRFLGMPVTHGCVRLGDEELNIVYHTLDIGSKVFIY